MASDFLLTHMASDFPYGKLIKLSIRRKTVLWQWWRWYIVVVKWRKILPHVIG